MRTGAIRVACVACGKRSDRLRREDGTFGPCRFCGGVLKRPEIYVDRRMLKARLEIQAQMARTR